VRGSAPERGALQRGHTWETAQEQLSIMTASKAFVHLLV
jgi:hypothetical protein